MAKPAQNNDTLGDLRDWGEEDVVRDSDTGRGRGNKIIFHSFEDMDFFGLELTIEEDGSVVTDFEIPGVGIEEINVLFQGKLLDCELVDSDGGHYQDGHGSVTVVNGVDFLLMKVQNPVGGRWQAVAYGDPDTVVSLYKCVNLGWDIFNVETELYKKTGLLVKVPSSH